MEFVERNCPLCGSSDKGTIFAEANFNLDKLGSFGFASRKMPEFMHYRLVKCPECDLAYGSPLPKLGPLADAYEAADFDSGEEAAYAARTYGSYVAEFVASLSSQHGAIDIGTGDGVFLEELLKLKFDNVIGVEPSTAPINAAKAAIRPLIRQGLFTADDLEGTRAALVTCFQTIEHVYDPLRMCHDAHKLLSEGGALFVIGHNRYALSALILKQRSPIYDIEHLQLFSARSLRGLLTRAGFSRVRVFPTVNRYPLHYIVKLLPADRAAKLKAIAWLKKTGIGNINVTLPLGNMGAIGYK